MLLHDWILNAEHKKQHLIIVTKNNNKLIVQNADWHGPSTNLVLRVYLYKLLQNSVLGLKWRLWKNYERLLLRNEILSFQNSLLGYENA